MHAREHLPLGSHRRVGLSLAAPSDGDDVLLFIHLDDSPPLHLWVIPDDERGQGPALGMEPNHLSEVQLQQRIPIQDHEWGSAEGAPAPKDTSPRSHHSRLTNLERSLHETLAFVSDSV